MPGLPGQIEVSDSPQTYLKANQTVWDDPYPYCEMCDMVKLPRNSKSNSCSRDVIITVAAGKLLSIFPFTRALRTAGCRARIIIFVDKKAREAYHEMYYVKMKDCGVEFINAELSTDYSTITFQRYAIYYDYLKKHRDEIDRVITVDLFDTCAQYDPFTTDFKKEKLYFQTEGFLMKNDPYNIRWMGCCHDHHHVIGLETNKSDINISNLLNNDIINGGEQAGGVDNMIKFLGIMIKTKNKCADQGFINYFYYSGIMQKEFNIDAVALPHNSEIFTAIGILAFIKSYRVDSNLTLGSIRVSGGLPALIHQSDRDPGFKIIITRACPNFYPPFPDYIRSY